MAKAKTKRRAKRAPAPIGSDRIMTVLGESPGVKTSDLAERMGVPQLQIRNEIMQLEQQGLVHRTGQTRGTRWYPGPGTGAAAHEEELPPEAGESADSRRGPKERVLDDNRALLGSLPDSEAARRTGVSVRTIAAYRKKHGITGYAGPRRRGGRAEPAAPAARPAAPAAAAPSRRPAAKAATNGASGNAAWRVDIRVAGESVVRYVFAPSLEAAARTATAGASSLGGQVIGIGWVGDALA